MDTQIFKTIGAVLAFTGIAWMFVRSANFHSSKWWDASAITVLLIGTLLFLLF